MRAKSFLYVSLGILALALAYHFGATTATAQAGSQVTGMAYGGTNIVVMTSNGECFGRQLAGGNGPFVGSVIPIGNFWTGPTPAQQPTFGQVKAQYRK
jgi:hypothetical protein